MNSIQVNNLTKKFGSFTAVDSISFNVKKGEIFGFLGANGAGKSTAIRMLCGILEPTSGDAVVGGFSVKNEPDKVKQNIGYMRSEERRVGKECRSRWSPYHYKKKKKM